MKVLVTLKRVADPDNANKVKIPASSSGLAPKIETAGLEWKPNPFDEYAIETALRLTENGTNVKARLGEVIVCTFGPPEADQTLRGALATGCDRAIRVEAKDEELDGDVVARGLAKIAQEQNVDLVVLGNQTADAETAQVAPLLAEYLGWPQATFAGHVHNEGPSQNAGASGAAGALKVGRTVDGGVMWLRVKLPAVLAVDDRIVLPQNVQSAPTPASHKYQHGIRFAPLPAIMQAKKKPLEVKKLADLGVQSAHAIKYLGFEPPPGRKAGVKVKDVAELVSKLKNEAKVL